jgi:ATP-binding cassette subfamily B protein
MSADSPRTASQPKPATQYPMTEEEIAQAAERQSNLLVLRKVAPYLWPDDMPLGQETRGLGADLLGGGPS